ncbi:hypothetical protein GIB67_022320 [Kingdonia uniflora]|uniref:3-hydroxyisobutyryl-CoA hydrolase n=1 Tax=Kingdonia uniflora TaxID=39325 RepID=A0A7J7KW46_9MAGN|nr:hypothetical protein GIB67_022320 [Kingdonia uniflora]
MAREKRPEAASPIPVPSGTAKRGRMTQGTRTGPSNVAYQAPGRGGSSGAGGSTAHSRDNDGGNHETHPNLSHWAREMTRVLKFPLMVLSYILGQMTSNTLFGLGEPPVEDAKLLEWPPVPSQFPPKKEMEEGLRVARKIKGPYLRRKNLSKALCLFHMIAHRNIIPQLGNINVLLLIGMGYVIRADEEADVRNEVINSRYWEKSRKHMVPSESESESEESTDDLETDVVTSATRHSASRPATSSMPDGSTTAYTGVVPHDFASMYTYMESRFSRLDTQMETHFVSMDTQIQSQFQFFKDDIDKWLRDVSCLVCRDFRGYAFMNGCSCPVGVSTISWLSGVSECTWNDYSWTGTEHIQLRYNSMAPDLVATPEPQIIIGEEKHVRFITLNRPRHLNVISSNMVSVLAENFEEWEKDDDAKLIIIKANDSCLEVVYRMYWLCYHHHTYKKTQVALVNGICMGGGASLVIPMKFSVVTEKAPGGSIPTEHPWHSVFFMYLDTGLLALKLSTVAATVYLLLLAGVHTTPVLVSAVPPSLNVCTKLVLYMVWYAPVPIGHELRDFGINIQVTVIYELRFKLVEEYTTIMLRILTEVSLFPTAREFFACRLVSELLVDNLCDSRFTDN